MKAEVLVILPLTSGLYMVVFIKRIDHCDENGKAC